MSQNGVSVNCLADLTQVQMGYPFRSRLDDEPIGDIAVIQMKDIDEGNLLHPETATRVSLPGGKDRYLLREGDLLFRSRGRSNGAALVGREIGPAVLAAPLLLIRPAKARVLPRYLSWFLNTPTTQARLATMATGTSVQMISADSLKTLEVPLPTLERQSQIADAGALAWLEQQLLSAIATRRAKAVAEQLMMAARTSGGTRS